MLANGNDRLVKVMVVKKVLRTYKGYAWIVSDLFKEEPE